jgi:F0F1-type ATP synthase assembly protein I
MMSDLRNKMRERSKTVWEGAKYTGIGLEFGLGIALCYWLGTWFDQSYQTTPYGSMLGVILGFASGLRSLVKIAKAQEQQSQNDLNDLK